MNSDQGSSIETSDYALQKLGRVILRSPRKIWDLFRSEGVAFADIDIGETILTLDQLHLIANDPQKLPLYQTYKMIERFQDKATIYLSIELAKSFGPELLENRIGVESKTPKSLYRFTETTTQQGMRDLFLEKQNKLISILKQLTNNQTDADAMIAYLNQGDFFGKIVAYTKEATESGYDKIQDNFEERVCEVVSEIIISLPGGVVHGINSLFSHPEIIQSLDNLLREFTEVYVDFIRIQCV